MPCPAPASSRRRRTARGWRSLLAGAALVVAGAGLAGCGDDQTGQPGLPDVDFTPTLVATVDGETISIEVGPQGDGEASVSADPPRMPVPGVLLLRFEGEGDHRIVGHLVEPGDDAPDLSDPDVATPAPLLDSGIQRAGDEVTVVLTDPGTLGLSPIDDRGDVVTVELTAG